MFPDISHMKHGPTLFLLTSDFTFVLIHAMAQRLEHHGMSASQIIVFRFLSSSAGSALVMSGAKTATFRDVIDFGEGKTRLSWMRGMIHIVGISAFYIAIRYLPISDALTLFHLKPFPVAIMSMLVLKEVISKVQVGAMAVVLVTQPTAIFGSLSQHQDASATELTIGYVAVSVASVLIGVDLVLLKMIGTIDPYFIMLVYSISACFSSAMYIAFASPGLGWRYSPTDWITLLALSILSFGAHIVETIAVQRVSGMHAALMGYSQIVFAAIVQFIFTSTLPSPLAILGSAIIVVAGVWCIVKGSAPAKDGGNTPDGYELVPQAEVER